MYQITTDICLVNFTENELIEVAKSELDWIIGEKEYNIDDITLEHLCQDISGHLDELTFEQFPESARKIVESVLEKKRVELNGC